MPSQLCSNSRAVVSGAYPATIHAHQLPCKRPNLLAKRFSAMKTAHPVTVQVDAASICSSGGRSAVRRTAKENTHMWDGDSLGPLAEHPKCSRTLSSHLCPAAEPCTVHTNRALGLSLPPELRYGAPGWGNLSIQGEVYPTNSIFTFGLWVLAIVGGRRERRYLNSGSCRGLFSKLTIAVAAAKSEVERIH